MNYKQARKDHEYLWAIGSAKDMTGRYVDANDLKLMLESPTKIMARICYIRQIEYWFDVGPDEAQLEGSALRDSKLDEIAKRYGCEDELEYLRR